jgi:hypothetical protein
MFGIVVKTHEKKKSVLIIQPTRPSQNGLVWYGFLE